MGLGNAPFSPNKASSLWSIRNLMSLSVPECTFSRDIVAFWGALGKCHYVYWTDEETEAEDLPKVTWWVRDGPWRSDPPFCLCCRPALSQAQEAFPVTRPPCHPPGPALHSCPCRNPPSWGEGNYLSPAEWKPNGFQVSIPIPGRRRAPWRQHHVPEQ